MSVAITDATVCRWLFVRGQPVVAAARKEGRGGAEGNRRLQDYKLAFGSPQGRLSLTWHGSSATILHSPGDEVWGVVWRMNKNDLSSLDDQEGVEGGLYVPIEVNVNTEEGKILCRSYQMKDYVCNLPSPHYKKVICMGAKQNGLPVDYQKKLEAIETNNYTGNVPLFEEIEAAVRASGKTT